ncbi:hypothetical protein QBC45DRAFT_87373 [Copromyces sp. CBS 386.78]|nr:hypothetical protein QBC45DRAFT_87373 [Copromyces sp. CBS 386.78]
MLLRYHFVLARHHNIMRQEPTINQKETKKDEYDERRTTKTVVCFFSFQFLAYMLFYDTPSVFGYAVAFAEFLLIPFSYLHQYLDSESALTPSLGRRVGTETLVPKGRRRQCFYAIANAGSRGRFCFFCFCFWLWYITNIMYLNHSLDARS